MRPSQTILALEELRKSFSTPLYRKGARLTPKDTQTVLDVYQQWLLLMTDLEYLHPGNLLRMSRRLWTDMVKVDVLDLNNAFAELLHLVRTQDDKGFKGLCSVISAHLYNIVKDDMARVTRGDVFAAKRLVQAFAYTSRLSLQDIDLTQQMLEDYLAVEASIPLTFPDPLIRDLNFVIRRWMKSFDPTKIVPRHSKNGVAFLGRTSLEVKYKNLTTDGLLEYAFGTPDWLPEGTPVSLERVSQTVFVPKSYKTFRTISMENPTLMYFQQGVWSQIDELVRSDRYLRSHIDFHVQDRNKTLAKRASIGRDFATLDLSSASDSVSYDLVKKLFRGTKLLRYIVATRSHSTMFPTGQIVRLRKFAAMGSALTFPIETIIFAAICELVTQEFRLPGKYSVYGDDIIVPTAAAERTIDVLTQLGFKVNTTKSFYHDTSWFRESCGGEYCDGFDVTPMRVGRNYATRERGVRLQALIDSANEAYVRGFRNLRQNFLREIRLSDHTALFSPTSILADNYTNYHAKKKWNANLQRIEVKVSDLSPRYKKEDIAKQDESIRYRHWLESTQQRSHVVEGFVSVVCKPTESKREVWRAKPYDSFDQEIIDKHVSRAITPAL